MRKEWLNSPPSRTYKIVQRDFNDANQRRGHSEFSIREVYRDDDGTVLGYSKPIELRFEALEDLIECLAIAHEARAYPILNIKEHEFKEITDFEAKQEKRKRKIEAK